MTDEQKLSINKFITASEFLDNLAEFLGDSEGQDLADLKNELREEGIDIDSLVAKVKSMVNKLKRRKAGFLSLTAQLNRKET